MRLGRRQALAGLVILAAGSVRARARAAAPDACPPERLEKLLADIARARASVTTLVGPFTQDRTIGMMSATIHSTGTLTLVCPDRLRWDLAPPDDVTYWVTPDGVAYRSPEGHGQIPSGSRRDMSALGDLRAVLGGDLASLRGRYDIEGRCHGDDPIVLRVAPKAGASAPFQEIRFTLSPDLVSPRTVSVVEGPRDRTEIVFGAMRVNAKIPPETMLPRAN